MTSKHVAEKGKKPTFERPVRLLRNVRSTNGYRGFNGKEALGGCALIVLNRDLWSDYWS